MKLEDVKDKIDHYFDNVSPEEVIKQFEDLGYKFISIDNKKGKIEYHKIKIRNMKNLRKGNVF